MGEIPETTRGTIEVLTRFAIAADRLGIDSTYIQPRLPELGTAPAQYARVSLDTADRLALRVPQASAPFARPGNAQRELGSDGVEVNLVFGRREFADDVALIDDVAPDVCDALIERITSLGGGRCDALGRRSDARWLAAVAQDSVDAGQLIAATSMLATIGAALGLPPRQRDLMQKAHLRFAPSGATYWLACAADALVPELAIEYREVAWKDVVGLTDALRPGTSSGPRLGVFAGALDAPRASAYTITFRPDADADVCIAIDHHGATS